MLIQPMIFEEWKDINFLGIKENQYLISNFGRVFSKVINRPLKPAISNGYFTVQLSLQKGGRASFYIHRLVAIAFIENSNPTLLTEVNHKNLKRYDNLSENLEWVTKEENILHELANKNHNQDQLQASKYWSDGYSTYGENNGMSKLKEAEVRIMLSAIENGASYKDAIIAAGLEPTENMRYNLSHIARGHRWKHVGKEYNIPKIIPFS